MKKFILFFLFAFLATFASAQQNPTLIYQGPGVTNYNGGTAPTGKWILGIVTNGATVGMVPTFTNVSPFIVWKTQSGSSGGITNTTDTVPWLDLTTSAGVATLATNATKIPLGNLPLGVVTGIANLGLVNSLPMATSNGIAYFKPILPGAYQQILDNGTNLVVSVTNLNLSDTSLTTGILPSNRLGTGVQDGSTVLNSTGGWTVVSGGVPIIAVNPMKLSLVNGTNTITINTNGNAATYLDGTGAFTTPSGSGSGNADTTAVFQVWLPTGTNVFGVLKTTNGTVLDLTNTATVLNKTLTTPTINGLKLGYGSANHGGIGNGSNMSWSIGTSSSKFGGLTGDVANVIVSGAANEGPYVLFVGQDATGNRVISNWSSSFNFPQGQFPVSGKTASLTNGPLIFWGTPNVANQLWYVGPSDTFPFTRTFGNPVINAPWTNSNRRADVRSYINLNPSVTDVAQAELWLISPGATNKLGPVKQPANLGVTCIPLSALVNPYEIVLITNTSPGTATVQITNSVIANW